MKELEEPEGSNSHFKSAFTHHGCVVVANNSYNQKDYNGQWQAGLWFGKTDDLWRFGKPQGHGGVWQEKDVKARKTSDPYLFFGFDRKVVHFRNDGDEAANFNLEVDFLGNGTWGLYDTIGVGPKQYKHHVFPESYSAEWLRVRSSTHTRATAWFVYD